jgi:hypothetical protein
MPRFKAALALAILTGLSSLSHAKDPAAIIRKAVEKSTLNQPGTKPFHLKAVIAPSRPSEETQNRTATVEMWWSSPSQWRRQIVSPEFRQVAIVNGAQEWQKNEGDYFPEWLREVAVALVNPVPALDQVLAQVESGEEKDFRARGPQGQVLDMKHFSWMMMSTNGEVQKAIGGALAISGDTGLLMYGGGFGWSGEFREPESFHGRMVSRTVNSGTPQVTAKVTVLEDLKETSTALFDTSAALGDPQLLRTLLVDEISLRKNLLPMEPPKWPPVKDGPLDGVLTTQVAVDRMGRVREVGSIVTDNPALSEAARETILNMRFKPYPENGQAVQVVSRITMAFKTTRLH